MVDGRQNVVSLLSKCEQNGTMLIIFSGLPGAGKTAVARALAGHLDALYLRIDSIEQAIRDSGAMQGPLDGTGYEVAYAVAADNLRLGRTVIADSVNPLKITRDAWRRVATDAQVRAIEIEVCCSNQSEHQRRVETRTSDVEGLDLPSWNQVLEREYEPWDREHLVIDTAELSVEESVAKIQHSLDRIRYWMDE
jgi:predicted kinase